jgi:hypothetical protein
VPAAELELEPEPARRRGLFARLFARRRGPGAEPPAEARTDPARAPAPAPEPRAEAEPTAAEPGVPIDAGRAEAILVGVLDDLGAARHRPFSRG